MAKTSSTSAVGGFGIVLILWLLEVRGITLDTRLFIGLLCVAGLMVLYGGYGMALTLSSAPSVRRQMARFPYRIVRIAPALREEQAPPAAAAPTLAFDAPILEGLRLFYNAVGDAAFSLAWDILFSITSTMRESGNKFMADTVKDATDLYGNQRILFAEIFRRREPLTEAELVDAFLAFYHKYRRIVAAVEGSISFVSLDAENQTCHEKWVIEHAAFKRRLRDTVAQPGFELLRSRLGFEWEREL